MLTRSGLRLFSAVLLSLVPIVGTAGVARSVGVCFVKEWDGTATQLSEDEIKQTIQQTLYDPKINQQYEQYPDAGYNCSVPNKLVSIGPSVVPHLIPLLKDQDARVRLDVVTALGSLGKSAQSAIPALIALFKEENSLPEPRVKTRAQRFTAVAPSVGSALRMMGESAIPDLILLLKDENVLIRSRAASVLGSFGKSAQPAIPALIALFKEEYSLPEPRVETRAQRFTAVAPAAGNALRMMGELAVPDLILLLRDENVLIRSRAALVLGNIGIPAESAIPDIIPLLSDKDQQVQRMAFIALGGIGESAIPVLTPLLKDRNELIRQGGMESLKVMGEPAIPVLVALLNDDDKWLRFEAVGILRDMPNSIDVTGKVKEPKRSVIPALVPLLKDKSSRIRSQAAIALGRMGRPGQSVILSLLPFLNDEDASVRANMALAFGNMGESHVTTIQNLRSLVRSEDASVRSDAVSALEEIEGFAKVVIPHLIPLLKDQNITVRTRTILALASIQELDSVVSSNPILLLKNKDPHRQSAAEALKQLSDKP
jgi:HEAT repeat protein